MDGDTVRSFLAGDEGVDHVLAQAERLRVSLRITGVPLFVVGKYKISGAQDSDVRVNRVKLIESWLSFFPPCQKLGQMAFAAHHGFFSNA
jgi:predicted DsbA family dithiol-disulfide isomerase